MDGWMDGWHQAHIDAIDFAENIKADRDAQQTELARQEFDVQVPPFYSTYYCSYSDTEFGVQIPPFYSTTVPANTEFGVQEELSEELEALKSETAAYDAQVWPSPDCIENAVLRTMY